MHRCSDLVQAESMEQYKVKSKGDEDSEDDQIDLMKPGEAAAKKSRRQGKVKLLNKEINGSFYEQSFWKINLYQQ